MTTESGGRILCRVTGALFLIGALSFAAAATVLSTTFDWPDILRQPADVVLTEFAAGGPSLVWTWFATTWTYAILVVPILLLPAALGRRDDAALWVASFAGAISVVLALIGFLRWVLSCHHSRVFTKRATPQTGAPWRRHGLRSINSAARY